MDKPAPARFRPYIQVLTERTRPEPIFVVVFTGVNFWLRLEVPTDVLILSPSQKGREIGRIIREHYAMRKGSAVPFGRIVGYVFRSLPGRGTRYDVDGKAVATGKGVEPTLRVEVSFALR